MYIKYAGVKLCYASRLTLIWKPETIFFITVRFKLTTGVFREFT